jgi:hypothetical protein
MEVHSANSMSPCHRRSQVFSCYDLSRCDNIHLFWRVEVDTLETSADLMFMHPEFSEVFLYFQNRKFISRFGNTGELADSSATVDPSVGNIMQVISLTEGSEPLAVFRSGATLSFFKLTDPDDPYDQPVPPNLPGTFTITPLYPYPFNPTVSFTVACPEKANLRIEVFNTLGQRVATVHDAIVPAGECPFRWDASGFSSGVYFIRFATDKHATSRKAVLLK